MTTYLPQMFKAIVAFVTTVAAEFGLAQVDGVTWGEWGFILGTALAVAVATWAAPNASAPGTATQPEAVEPPVEFG